MQLELAAVLEETDGVIVHGMIHCPEPACMQEYPILDGIPVLVPDVRAWVGANLSHLTARTDLPHLLESLLGDAAGPGSVFDATRQHLSTYGWDHWADLDPARTDPGQASRVAACFMQGMALLEGAGAPHSRGPVVDLGCSVGRVAFEWASRVDDLVLGVDVNFSMLQVAQRILREGLVSYPLRRIGVVYDRVAHSVASPGAERVDFWAADALALPFRAGVFGAGTALNLLDCVGAPSRFLDGAAAVLRQGAPFLLATPYDWSPSVTPMEQWIGGHSQRGPTRGAAEPFLRTLLTPGAHPASTARLEMLGEVERVPWHARLHDRSTVEYAVHLVAARAR